MKKLLIFLIAILTILSSVLICEIIYFKDKKDKIYQMSQIETVPEVIEIKDSSIKDNYDHDIYQQKIETVAKQYGATAVSVALIDDGEVIDTFSYGSAIKGQLPMTEDTKVRMASISKVFLGIATMISIENGTMKLDEDIGTYWGFKIGNHVKEDIYF